MVEILVGLSGAEAGSLIIGVASPWLKSRYSTQQHFLACKGTVQLDRSRRDVCWGICLSGYDYRANLNHES